MDTQKRRDLQTTILKREKLRPLSRVARLLRDPLRALPYYILAAVSHIKPFKVHFKTLWNTDMTCYLPEGNTFYYYGYCEANLTNFFIHYVQEGMTVLDVGAHVGIYSMLSSELVGDSGHVYSFEPTPWTHKILEENTSKLGNVTIFNKAVAKSENTLTFKDYGPGYGAYNTAHEGGSADIHSEANTITVTSVALDNFCTQKNAYPDLIKIDAEGFEYEVLQGANALLSDTTTKRPLVTIEVAGGAEWAKNRTDSFSLLNSFGYIPFEIQPEGTVVPHTLKSNYTYDNLLFIPKERLAEFSSTDV